MKKLKTWLEVRCLQQKWPGLSMQKKSNSRL
jgi:hypothetical protein